MLNEYKLVSILHSGRKGIRGTPVDNSKYDHLIDSDVWFDINECERFKTIRFLLKHHPYYDWWDTSAVLAVSKSVKNDVEKVIIETENTIYELERIYF